jgi:hypothetical protein
MMDIDIVVILVVVAAFVLGKAYGEFVQAHNLIQNLSKDPDHFIQLLTKLKTEVERLKTLEQLDLPEDAVELNLELVNGMYFCYRADTNEFLGQDADKENLLISVSKRLKGVKIWAKDINESNQTA